MQQIFIMHENQIADALNYLQTDGVMVFGGCSTPFKQFSRNLKKLAESTKMILIEGFVLAPNNGYLYFLYDGVRFSHDDAKRLVCELDSEDAKEAALSKT